MAYIAPIHEASSIRYGIKARFLHEDRNALIIAKSNKIEVYDIVPEGIVLQTHFTIYGRVTGLLSLKPESSRLEHLFICTDRQGYLTVSWDAEQGTIRNERKATDITDQFQRPASCGHLYLKDPGGRMLGLCLYEGLFTAFPLTTARKGRGAKGKAPMTANELDIGNLDEHAPIRMKELKVQAMTFLYGTTVPVVAVLHCDSRDVVHLMTYEVKVPKKGVEEAALNEWNIKMSNMGLGHKLLIPVPDPIGGLFVLGEQYISYHHQDRPTPLKRSLREASSFVAYAMGSETEYYIGDDMGKLHCLKLVVDEENRVKSLKFDQIGDIPIAKCMVYLDNGLLFIGSHFGDGQLLRVSDSNPRIEVVHTLTNLAPISDFTVVGTELAGTEVHQYASGQTTVLTCSGGFFDGGLRSVKSGVKLEDFGILSDMTGVRGTWVLKGPSGSRYDETLVLSFVDETRVFSFDSEGDVEELGEYQQFDLTSKTLAAANTDHDRILQVVPDKIRLVDGESGTIIEEWSPPNGSSIVTAAINDSQLIVVVDGLTLLLFDLTSSSISQIGSRTFEHEIASITISTAPSTVCAVAFWTTSTVATLAVPGLNTICQDTLANTEGAIPRSLVLARIVPNRPPYLFVAMGDGTLYSYSVSETDGTFSEKKSIVLGTQSINLQTLGRKDRDGIFNVVATCDHPTLIYGEEGKLVYSAITAADQAAYIVPFDARAFPDSVIIASETELKIAKIDDVRSSHTETLPLKQFARRVAISKQTKMIGLGTIRTTFDDATGMELTTCHFQVVEQAIFAPIDSYQLQENEMVEALICMSLSDSNGSSSEKFIVGTSISSDTPDDVEETGRVLIFEVGQDKQIRLLAQHDLKKHCYSLGTVQDHIVVGTSKAVHVYKFSYSENSADPKLTKVASAPAASIPVSIAVTGNQIFVGDLMKGVMVLEFVLPGSEQKDGSTAKKAKLEEVCRQYAVNWVTALEALDKETCVCADADLNISVLKRDVNGISEEDRRRLNTISEIRLGEMVNKIKRVNEPQIPNSAVIPQAYIGTVEGSLYLFGLIHPEFQDLLMKLQANLSKVVRGVGDLSFNRYRAFNCKGRNPDEPFRFVDGELIEKFLDLDEDDMEEVIKGEKSTDKLDVTIEEMKNMVEALKRLH